MITTVIYLNIDLLLSFLTNTMATIWQMTYWNAFSLMKDSGKGLALKMHQAITRTNTMDTTWFDHMHSPQLVRTVAAPRYLTNTDKSPQLDRYAQLWA